jgi:2-alkenal reductase
MTMGIVSGIGRTMDSLHESPDGGNFTAGDIIQTDAAINPGNSGGPLLNLNGEVIGINRAIFTTSFSNSGQPLSSGLGFAISSNIVRRVVPSLITDGKYDYPYVGISSISEFSLEDQEALGLTRSTGVYVLRVIPGGPADQAGLQGAGLTAETPGLESGGDLIIAIDGVEVLTYSDFISYLIKNKSPDDRVVLTVLRRDTEIQVELTLGRRPEP